APAGPPVAALLPTIALRYARGLAIGLGAGFWAGLLMTGPAVRLIMRLLAATAGAEAQGALTEAEEVVGDISLGGLLASSCSAAYSLAS
ncbi:MAG: hypothetical protein ACRD0M_08230, partial [Acidimicrobiales bacterium]